MDTSWGSFGWTWFSTLDLKTRELLLLSSSRCSPTSHMSVIVFLQWTLSRTRKQSGPLVHIMAIVSGLQQQNTVPASQAFPHLITLSSLTDWWVDIHLICLFFILLYCDNNNDDNTTNYFTCAALFILQMPRSLIKKNKQMKWENRNGGNKP